MRIAYTTSQAARLWNVSPRVLQKAAATGRIPSFFWGWGQAYGNRGRSVRLFYPGAQNYLYQPAGRPAQKFNP